MANDPRFEVYERMAESPTKPDAKKGRCPWKADWLDAYQAHGTATSACEVVGINRSTAYEARKKDPEFAKAWDALESETTKLLEETLYERALNGDTTAAIFMLKARRPAVYRESLNVKHGGKVGVTVEIEEGVDEAIDGLLAENDRLTERLAELESARQAEVPERTS
jgi:predicted DNA-binding antitoxin AbrB/MazE fold protein